MSTAKKKIGRPRNPRCVCCDQPVYSKDIEKVLEKIVSAANNEQLAKQAQVVLENYRKYKYAT